MALPEIEYISTGASLDVHVGDWHGDLLAFGAGTNVALWQPTASPPRGIATVLRGHQDSVTVVKFLPSAGGRFLVTAGCDQTIKLWRIADDLSHECVQTVHEHSRSVKCIAILRSWQDDAIGPTLLASGSADYTVKIWKFESGQLRLVQSIETTPRYSPLALALTSPGDDSNAFILAAAGTSHNCQIFTASGQDGDPEFTLQTTLTGHEDWIRSLDFMMEKDEPGSDLLLASASQDKYIRLWRVRQGKQPGFSWRVEASRSSDHANLTGQMISLTVAHGLKLGGRDYYITFEALLVGHEDWIYSAKWMSPSTRKLSLLSASADNSLNIWEPDPSSGIWISTVRLGEVSREKGATTATGSFGGFETGLSRDDGKSVVCLGRTGSWRRWDYDEAEDQWRPALAVTGHVKAVTGIAWSKNGSYLLSTSSDQTTRLHTAWGTGNGATWHELSRPQIHGYDLNCIDSLGDDKFVSGADEKLLRVFSEPKAVARLINKLGSTGLNEADDMPDVASIPVLGLSNKAFDASPGDEEPEGEGPKPGRAVWQSALDIDRPPFEDVLSRYTLWPEIEKLYGHGYEISCVAVSHDAKIIASACKATSTNHAVIRLFETQKWTEVKPPLTAHSLTATRLRFSRDDRYLLSVGRDRVWAVFERDAQDQEKYVPLQSMDKAHSRMILDAAWAPGPEKRIFATAGRDKQVKIWVATEVEGKLKFSMASSIPGTKPITAIDFMPTQSSEGRLVLAIGDEDGKLSIISLRPEDLAVASTTCLKEEFCPSQAILQLAWRPVSSTGSRGHELAIASEDTTLRIYAFHGV